MHSCYSLKTYIKIERHIDLSLKLVNIFKSILIVLFHNYYNICVVISTAVLACSAINVHEVNTEKYK